MMVFTEQKLAFIAVPKTGTTAIEVGMRHSADITFSKQRKHMTAQRFHRKIAPFLDDAFNLRPERFAVMREPEDQLRSWYKYRHREFGRRERRAKGMSFDAFVLDVIKADPPPYARVGSQLSMLTGQRGKLLVHHLFAYEAQEKLHGFLRDRFQREIEFKPRNVSPHVDAPLNSEIRAELRAARAEEFALYDRVMQAGGHLITEF